MLFTVLSLLSIVCTKQTKHTKINGNTEHIMRGSVWRVYILFALLIVYASTELKAAVSQKEYRFCCSSMTSVCGNNQRKIYRAGAGVAKN